MRWRVRQGEMRKMREAILPQGPCVRALSNRRSGILAASVLGLLLDSRNAGLHLVLCGAFFNLVLSVLELLTYMFSDIYDYA